MRIDELSLEEIVRIAAVEGAKQGIRQVKQIESDRLYHNTKKLLERYRAYSQFQKSAVTSFKQLESSENYLQMMELSDCEVELDSVKRTIIRTELLLINVREALELYRAECENSISKTCDKYKVIYESYISNEIQSPLQIAEKLNISERTVRRYKKEAVEEISSYLWGLDLQRLSHGASNDLRT